MRLIAMSARSLFLNAGGLRVDDALAVAAQHERHHDLPLLKEVASSVLKNSAADESDDARTIPPIVHNVKSSLDRGRVARAVARSRFESRLDNCTKTDAPALHGLRTRVDDV